MWQAVEGGRAANPGSPQSGLLSSESPEDCPRPSHGLRRCWPNARVTETTSHYPSRLGHCANTSPPPQRPKHIVHAHTCTCTCTCTCVPPPHTSDLNTHSYNPERHLSSFCLPQSEGQGDCKHPSGNLSTFPIHPPPPTQAECSSVGSPCHPPPEAQESGDQLPQEAPVNRVSASGRHLSPLLLFCPSYHSRVRGQFTLDN